MLIENSSKEEVKNKKSCMVFSAKLQFQPGSSAEQVVLNGQQSGL
jgi:hypothetical protein